MRKRKSFLIDYIPIVIVGAMMLALVMAILIGRAQSHKSYGEEKKKESRIAESTEKPQKPAPLPVDDSSAPEPDEKEPEDEEAPVAVIPLPQTGIEATTEKKKVFLTEEDFFVSLKSMLEYFHKHNMKFSRNGGGKTLKGSKGFNCATYVSWTLQEMGLIPKGKTMWFSKKPHGAAYDYIKDHPEKFKILHPDQPVKKCPDLKPGDICGFTINGYAPHTTVYAGTDDKGHPLWYSGGGDYRKMRENGFQATRFKYYEQNNDIIYTIVRIRYDKVEKKGTNSNGIVKVQ